MTATATICAARSLTRMKRNRWPRPASFFASRTGTGCWLGKVGSVKRGISIFGVAGGRFPAAWAGAFFFLSGSRSRTDMADTG